MSSLMCPACGEIYSERKHKNLIILQCIDCKNIGIQVENPNIGMESVLHLNFRYSGAWAEYGQRLLARHQALNAYLTASALILGFLYANRHGNLLLYYAVAIVLPISSLIFSMIAYMHDSIMAEIHVFLIRCEIHNNIANHHGGHSLPSYHAPQKMVRSFLFSRQLYSSIIILIFLLTNSASILFSLYRFLELDAVYNFLLVLYYILYAFILLTAISLVFESMDRRVNAVRHYTGDFQIPTLRHRIRDFYSRRGKRLSHKWV